MIPKTVAIHQPNYLPWTGYFLKMAVADHFIFHDNVKITKAGPTRRVQIAGSNANTPVWLSVPLQKHSDFTLIKDVAIIKDNNWIKKHLAYIRASYYGFPHYKHIFSLLEAWLFEYEQQTFLARLNAGLIEKIASIGTIKATLHFSSEMPAEGKKDEYNLYLTKMLEGNIYISGKGAIKYQDEATFIANEIRLVYADTMAFYQSFIQKNRLTGVNASLSVIDFLMLNGCDAFADLTASYKYYFNSLLLEG
jgi:hypothetical protein